MTKQWQVPCFGVSLALGRVLEVFLRPTTEWAITKCHIQFTFHHRSQSREMVCCCCVDKRRRHFKTTIFFNSQPAHEASTYQAFSPSVCFKCRMTIEWLTLSTWAAPHVDVRESASMILSLGHCQLPMAGHYTPHLQGSNPLWKTSWSFALYVH